MLASAIFVKLPFAVWLMIYEKNRLKIAGWIGLFLGFTATFFMAARAFYVGLIILTAIFMVYLLINYLFSKQKDLFRIAGFYLAALLLGLIIFSVTQQFLYPEIKTERYTESVGKQLATINTAESSVIARLEGWRWSWEMVKEKPILGVGSGNWKVNVLKYENQEHSIFTYLYKAHNDYLETLAETGLLGGLLYLGIFVLMAWALVQRIIKKESAGNNELYPFLFLAVSGLAFYSIDALFNFPADRPEIQIIFAFYLASGIAWMKYQEKKDLNDKSILQKKITNKWFRYIFLTVAITVAVASAYLLYLNFESSKLQRIAQQEILAGRLKSSANLFLQGFPSIPSVNINGEPIATLKGRYLINEGKYQEAIAVMRPDRSSPWDSRREYFMAMAFDNMGMTDSAAKYAERAYELKPFNYKHVKIYCLFLEQEGEYEKALSCLQKYLEVEKSNSEAWVFSSDLLTGQGKIDEAWKLIEQAKGILPQDSLIENQHKILYDLKFVGPNKKYFDEAMSYVNQGEYTKALSLIDKYIGAVPNDFTSHQQRAIILYYLKEYQSCIKEIDLSLTLKNNVGFLINLRGVCYYALNDLTSACKDFESASQLGIADGKTNYDRFCKEKLQ